MHPLNCENIATEPTEETCRVVLMEINNPKLKIYCVALASSAGANPHTELYVSCVIKRSTKCVVFSLGAPPAKGHCSAV